MKRKRNSPWVWIPTLFATEAIVSATITYVAILMFYQLGASYTKATFLSALLMVPSMGKALIRWNYKWNVLLKVILIIINILLFAAFVFTAFVIDHPQSNIFKVFGALFLVAVINALNEKFIALYYDNLLNRGMQRILGNYKFVSTQISFILTYGILIIFVGFHEIFFRNIHLAWSMEYYMVAGVLLILLIFNAILLTKPRIRSEVTHVYHYKRMNNRKIRLRNIRFLFIISILLLPQSLLFFSRVFFLIAPESHGGLDFTLQDIGFAQGTIGVLAFMTGTFIGQHLIRRYGNTRMFWIMIPPLIASPIFYLIVFSCFMPASLMTICLLTFASQLCFGFGLNVCVFLIQRTTDVFEDNIISLMHVPLVAVAMFLPLALSGLLVSTLQFKFFFIFDAVLSIICLIIIIYNRQFINRHIINYKKIK